MEQYVPVAGAGKLNLPSKRLNFTRLLRQLSAVFYWIDYPTPRRDIDYCITTCSTAWPWRTHKAMALVHQSVRRFFHF
jgi:hypothetical protein